MKNTLLILFIAIGTLGSASLQAESADSDPVRASISVYTQVNGTQRFQAFCAKIDEDSAAKIKSIEDDWLAENSALYQKANNIIAARFSQSDVAKLKSYANRDFDAMVAGQLANASPDEKIFMCKAFVNGMQLNNKNLLKNKVLVSTIMNHKL